MVSYEIELIALDKLNMLLIPKKKKCYYIRCLLVQTPSFSTILSLYVYKNNKEKKIKFIDYKNVMTEVEDNTLNI